MMDRIVLLHEPARAITEVLVDGVAQGVVVTACVALGLYVLLPPGRAGTRHTVWFFTLLTVAFLPIALLLWPRITADGPGSGPSSTALAGPAGSVGSVAAVGTVTVGFGRGEAGAGAGKRGVGAPASGPGAGAGGTDAGVGAPGVGDERGTLPAAGSGESRAEVGRAGRLHLPIPAGRWLVILLAFAGAVSLLRLARLAVALHELQRLKRASHPLPDHDLTRLVSLLPELGRGRTVAVRISDGIPSPVAVGFRRPAILVPRRVWGALATDELVPLLLHELAHLRRRDDWVHLVQRTIEALLYFHPAVLWIGRRLDLERELACDDAAAAGLGDRRHYARCLTRLASFLAEGGASPALNLVSRRGQLRRRVSALLTTKRLPSPRFTAAMGAAVTALMLAGAAALIRHAPRVALGVPGPSSSVQSAGPGEPADQLAGVRSPPAADGPEGTAAERRPGLEVGRALGDGPRHRVGSEVAFVAAAASALDLPERDPAERSGDRSARLDLAAPLPAVLTCTQRSAVEPRGCTAPVARVSLDPITVIPSVAGPAGGAASEIRNRGNARRSLRPAVEVRLRLTSGAPTDGGLPAEYGAGPAARAPFGRDAWVVGTGRPLDLVGGARIGGLRMRFAGGGTESGPRPLPGMP